MITDAPRQTQAPPPLVASGQASSQACRERSNRPLITFILGLLAVGLIGFNAWWYWRDSRPVADKKMIAAWLTREEYALAEPALKAHRRQSPHDGEVRTMLARLFAAQGNYIGCAQELHQVADWWPTKVEALYREGQAYLMADRAKDAEAAWLKAIADDPLHPGPADTVHDASLELLKLYSTEDRWEDLHDILWNAYERANSEDHLTLLSMRIRSEIERLAPEVAVVQLERYVAADPTDWEALRALARAELALGRKQEAQRHFEMCVESRPEDPRGWRDYLTMLHDLGDLEAWTALLQRVPAAAESDPEIWRFRGLRKEKDGDWAGAAEDFRQALKLNPYLTSALYRLAMVEERLGNRDVAAQHRKKTEILREARNELRTTYIDLHNAEDARVRQVPISPDLPTCMKRLAVVCEKLGWARLADAWNKLAESS